MTIGTTQHCPFQIISALAGAAAVGIAHAPGVGGALDSAAPCDGSRSPETEADVSGADTVRHPGESSRKAPSPSIAKVYDEVVHWKKNFFKVPTGAPGKAFVSTLALLLQQYVDSSGSHETALYSMFVFPVLMLQLAPGQRAESKCSERLQHRLDLWTQGDLGSLVHEGRAIQQSQGLPRRGGKRLGAVDPAREFSSRMTSGRVHDALRGLQTNSTDPTSGVLSINDSIVMKDGVSTSVERLLLEKHPQPKSAELGALLRVLMHLFTQLALTQSLQIG